MSDNNKKGSTALTIVGFAAVIIIIIFAHTIFPVMREDEYFVDKYGVIHDKHCEYKKVPWFKFKNSNYDFMMKSDWDWCDECFLYDREKMELISDYNISAYVRRMKGGGETMEYISGRLEKYKWSDQSGRFQSDEYVVDVYDRIHNPECEDILPYYYRGVKYEFKKKKGWSFCEKCITPDEAETLTLISDKNIERELELSERIGRREEREKFISKYYEWNPDEDE